MTHLAAYLKEREGVEVLETGKGFAVFIISGVECYIRDIWVKPEFRRQNVASTIADEITTIAKDRGCTLLLGTVCPSANGSTHSLKVLLGYGMTLRTSENNLIWFSKEIK